MTSYKGKEPQAGPTNTSAEFRQEVNLLKDELQIAANVGLDCDDGLGKASFCHLQRADVSIYYFRCQLASLKRDLVVAEDGHGAPQIREIGADFPQGRISGKDGVFRSGDRLQQRCNCVPDDLGNWQRLRLSDGICDGCAEVNDGEDEVLKRQRRFPFGGLHCQLFLFLSLSKWKQDGQKGHSGRYPRADRGPSIPPHYARTTQRPALRNAVEYAHVSGPSRGGPHLAMGYVASNPPTTLATVKPPRNRRTRLREDV